MNSNGRNPVWGSWGDDAAARLRDDIENNDDALVKTDFATRGNVSNAEVGMEDLNAFNTADWDKKVVMGGETQLPGSSHNHSITDQEQTVLGNICLADLENIIENFNKTSDDESFNRTNVEYGFYIEKSKLTENTSYKVKNNCIYAGQLKAITINVSGAKSGHVVKMQMRFKDKIRYHEPVLACKEHYSDWNPNPNSSFYVVSVHPVTYEMEDGHPTAIMTVPMVLEEPFSFYPVFRCLKSCSKTSHKKHEMMLSLCDATTKEVLHRDSFDIRVCQHISRDSQEKKGVKRPMLSTSEEPSHHQIENEAKACKEVPEGVIDQASALVAAPAPKKSRLYMVELDEELFRAVDAVVKLKGKELIEVVNAASLCDSSA